MKPYFFLIILLFFASSCEDELDLYPRSAVSPEAVSAEDLASLENGMYNSVQNYPGRESWILFDLIGGGLSGSSGVARDLINGILDPLTGMIVNSWNGYYRSLYQINTTLEVTDALPQSPDVAQVSGTAHYFRAYVYYSLVTRWGDVPILRENTTDLVSRDREAEVWQFIEEELKLAIELLDETAPNYYYVSRDAAYALMARVKLAQGEMEEAAFYSEMLITMGKYQLDEFDKIFRKKSNSEIIFAFENLSEESSNNLSSLFYTYAHPNRGSYLYRPTREFMEMYSSGDLRREISVTSIAGSDIVNKYPSGQTGTDPIIVSRIAEMYLISAEAQGRSEGLHRLNQLRNARGLNDINPGTDQQFMDAIMEERDKELLAEGFRYFDLIRTGRAATEIGLLDYQHVLPIPGRELLQNPNLEPNPGY